MKLLIDLDMKDFPINWENEEERDWFLSSISNMLSDISVEWSEISDEELFERIKRILALESISGILKELNPEQIEIFDEAVRRRPLFKGT